MQNPLFSVLTLKPQEKAETYFSYAAMGFIFVLHLIGVWGLTTNRIPQFKYLTPVHLLFSTVLILIFHHSFKGKFWLFTLFTYLFGLGAEVIGVQTGLLFGSYQYGAVLGYKIWGTPLIIGVNWLMLVYSSGMVINYLWSKGPWILKGISAASLMVVLDYFIEPVAMKMDFWSWPNNEVPLQNYIGWFMIALPLTLLFQKWFDDQQNRVAIVLFATQFTFFVILNILLK